MRERVRNSSDLSDSTSGAVCTLCLKKVPIFKLSVTLSYLNRFSQILHCWKRMKFATKPIWHRPPHLSHVATIPWEIKKSNFCSHAVADMKENASILYSPLTLLFVHKFWYFRCLKMGCLSPYSLQIIFCVTVVWLFTFAINLWHRKFVKAHVTAVFVNNQHGIQRRGHDFNKKFVFEGVHSKEVDRQISWETLDKAWC